MVNYYVRSMIACFEDSPCKSSDCLFAVYSPCRFTDSLCCKFTMLTKSSIICCRLTMASSDIIRFPATEQKSEDLKWARREEAFMDFKIRIGDEFLLCNKLVLANRSPYMKAMLTSGMTEVSNQEVRMDNITLDIMNIILDYMYCCDVSFHKDQLIDIAVAADYLHMTELEEFCIAEIEHIITPANVISWWRKSNNSGLTDLIPVCEKLMASNIGTISLSSDFLALSLAQIELYVSDIRATNTQSDEVLEAVMKQ